jgi:hypothetical protein
MAADDRVSAELAAIASRHAAISEPGGLAWDFDGGYAATDAGGVARLLSSTDDVPRLLAAVEAVLEPADGWLANAEAVPVLSREAAGTIIRAAIERELTRKDGPQ